MAQVDVYCKLCGAKTTRMLPSQRIWHQKCPKRGPKQVAPEYLPVTTEGDGSTLPERR